MGRVLKVVGRGAQLCGEEFHSRYVSRVDPTEGNVNHERQLDTTRR
jgi:hypothetical protein